jgi:uncharacterized protein YeaO (DUF488 family)
MYDAVVQQRGLEIWRKVRHAGGRLSRRARVAISATGTRGRAILVIAGVLLGMMHTITVQRAYERSAWQGGKRFLVDRLWPRGVSRDELHIDGWLKELAPSNELRKWFAHDPARWNEFQQRYRQELSAQSEELGHLLNDARSGDITLVYGARDVQHNEAIVLKEVLEERLA